MNCAYCNCSIIIKVQGGRIVKLTERERQILYVLMRMESFITGHELANELGVSLKTVQRDISSINQTFKKEKGVELITSARGKGYVINRKKIQFIDNELFLDKNIILNLKVDRIDWIISRFCIAELKNEAVTLNELSESLYIGLSTLKKDIQSVKDKLAKYHLELIKYGNKGMKIEGSEKDIRVLLTEYLFKMENLGIQGKISLKSKIKEKNIASVLRSILKEYEIQIADIGFNNLVLHIEVAILRINKGKISLVNNTQQIDTNSNEYLCAQAICSKIQEKFDLTFPEEEVINIYLHLSAQKVLLSEKNIQLKSDAFENTPEYHMVKDVLDEIHRIYGIDFRNDQILINGLLIHLKSAILRIKLQYPIHNELLEDIQKNYPFAMQLAFLLTTKISKWLKKNVDIHETGYIAIHFCGALERIGKKNKTTIKVILVCASGGGTSVLLRAKLENKYRDQISVNGIYSMFQLNDVDFSETDCIISTVPLQDDYPIPILYVTPIATDNDLNKIHHFIQEKQKEIHPHDLLSRDLFYANKQFESKEEIIQFMSQRLVDLGYIDKICQQSILEREKLASTEIGNMVAVPHNMGKGKVYRPSLSFMLLDQPIHWQFSDVKLIIMIVNVVSENKYYKNLFLKIYNKVNFQYKVNEIVKKKDFNYILNLFD